LIASCTLQTSPTYDLKLLNEARNGLKRLIVIFAISPKVLGRHRPTTTGEKARFSFLTIATAEKPSCAKIRAAVEEAAQLPAAHLSRFDGVDRCLGQSLSASSTHGGRASGLQ